MLLEAAGLALLASLSPTALLVTGVLLGSAQPRLTATFFLVGAVLMSLIMGLVLLVVLRSAHLSLPTERTPRYGFRLGLGGLLLLASLVVARRKPRTGSDEGGHDGLVSRMVTRPTPRSSFLVGVLVFAPGVSFLAAVQVVATARAGLDLTALAITIIVVINVLLVWLPIVLYLIAPVAAGKRLTSLNGWLRAHARVVLSSVLAVVGLIIVGNGIYGLAATG
jgi:hypothetical protein